MRKILLVIHTPPPYGGGEIQALNLKNHYKSNSQFIIYDYSRKSHSRSDWEGVQLKTLLFGVLWIFRVCCLIIFHRPAKLFFTLPKGYFAFMRNAFVIPIARLFGVTILGELPGTSFPFLESKKSFKYKTGLFFLRKIDEIRFLSESILYQHYNLGLKKTLVIENGIELPVKYTVNPETFGQSPLNLIYIGALESSKGIFNLLSAVKLCVKAGIVIQLNLLGYWVVEKDKTIAEELIISENIQDYVVFHGIKTHDEKWEIFSNSAILVHPTFWDGVPLTILEAMGLGLVVISTRVGGIPDTIVNKRNGFLLDENSPEKLYESLVYCYSNRDVLKEISERNKKVFAEKYNLPIFLRNMDNWYLT